MKCSVGEKGLSVWIWAGALIAMLVLYLQPGSACGQIIRSTQKDVSLKKEVERTYKNALTWLKGRQNADGSWSGPDYPALTGLVVYAFLTSPEYVGKREKPEFIQKGLDFMVRNAKENGGIYKEALPNYNTAICMMALMAANDPKYHVHILKARRYLMSQQSGEGGVGYGADGQTDLSNTYVALEALKMTEILESDQHLQTYQELKGMQKSTLQWDAALRFIQRCQNLPGSNDQSWASGDPQNKGGFVYAPGKSKAGEERLADGRVILRSYGSMTYAGLLSMVYADVKKDDPRVQAAYSWIKNHFTLDENPGMGQQGLYYNYHTMAKALTAYGEDYLRTPDGRKIDWRRSLTEKLVGLQKGEGYWVNDNGRWWENDPVLITAYAVITLNMVASF